MGYGAKNWVTNVNLDKFTIRKTAEKKTEEFLLKIRHSYLTQSSLNKRRIERPRCHDCGAHVSIKTPNAVSETKKITSVTGGVADGNTNVSKCTNRTPIRYMALNAERLVYREPTNVDWNDSNINGNENTNVSRVLKFASRVIYGGVQ